MVGNHVADLGARYGEGGAVPLALTDYVKARQRYDYSHHGKAGNPSTDFVPDDIVDRFCVLGTAEDHVAKLTELKELGVDQFNIYLIHDAPRRDAIAVRTRDHTGSPSEVRRVEEAARNARFRGLSGPLSS
jgi:alkanesulfonate monooxygenase SsuD/methylene tetrahydromethanopterin reductase-like flavin-dependent oxidoreductase (luciferase family)